MFTEHEGFPYSCPGCDEEGPEDEGYWEVMQWKCPTCHCVINLEREVEYGWDWVSKPLDDDEIEALYGKEPEDPKEKEYTQKNKITRYLKNE